MTSYEPLRHLRGQAQAFLAALDRYQKDAEVGETATPEGESPREVIELFFKSVISVLAGQEEPRRGCLITNSAVELASCDPDVEKRISLYGTRLADTFEQTIIPGQV